MQRKLIIIVAALGLLLSIVFIIGDLIAPRAIPGYELERNTEGGGEREETLEYELKDGTKGEVTLTIPESTYLPREAEQILKQALSQLDQLILGSNDSPDHISQNLNLVTSLPTSPVIISWNSSRMDLLDYEGILSNKIPKDGAEVQLEAELSLQNQKVVYQKTVQVFPPEPFSFSEGLRQKTSERNQGVEGSLYYLPESINEQKIFWKRKPSSQGITLLLLTLVGIAALYVAQRQEASHIQQRRRDQMMEDYPEVISKFLLLLSAGLSIRNCFERIAMDYKKQQGSNSKDIRMVYEEVVVTCREIKGGSPELKAYESFGKRCECPAYKTLSTLLCQSLKKGSKGMVELLEREAQNAFEDRKRQARIMGDKAGTKLILPMIMMLSVVLIILIVPAYLSFTV